MRYVIIGRGVAGVSAGLAIRKQDPSGDLLLISSEKDGYYSRPGLAYYLTGEITEEMLFPAVQPNSSEPALPQIHAQVNRIHPSDHRIELSDRSLVPYDRLLIATGATARRPDTPGIDLNGVVTLDSLPDARLILRLARKARAAVVIGGGITALELVEGLRARRLTTHYFLRGDRYWSNVLDEKESQIIEHRLLEDGVRIHYETEVEEILGKRGQVVGVRTKDNQVVKCQLVAVAVGISPRLKLAQAAGLEADRGILVDSYLRTSEEDIFAAGDVAQIYDPVSGKSILDSLWTPARQQGWTAGLNMAGAEAAYQKGIPFNVTRLAGLTTTIIGSVGRGRDQDLLGIARGDSESWRLMPDSIAIGDDFEVNRIRMVLGENHILGAILMGNQSLSRPLQELVTQQADISVIREQILQPGATLPEIIYGFWETWRATK